MRRADLLAFALAGAMMSAVVSGGPASKAQAADAPGVRVRKDFPYYDAADSDPARHLLDLHLPEEKKNFPVILFIHGGAWRSGSKDLYGPLAQSFVKRGIGVAVANYRLSPAVEHPEHAKDVARAFSWVVKNAKSFGGDPARIYLMGHSAGAHLVTLLALDPRYLKAEGLTSAAVRGVVGVSGPYTLGQSGFENVFGKDEAKRRDAFPLEHVGDLEPKEIPPFLILAADGDYPGLPQVARLLEEALRRRGVKVLREEIPDRDHISIISRVAQDDDPTAAQVLKFVAP